MSAYDELAAAVAEHGPFPMPTGDTADREQIRAELTAEFVAWLVKRAREHRAQGPQYAKQADVIGRLADKVSRGAVRPNNLLSLPPQGGPEDVPALRAEVARLSDELTGRSLALYEEELDTARLRLALASAQRGRRELRARVAELESPRPVRRFSRLEEAVQGVETAIAPLTGDAREGAAMVLAYLRTLAAPDTTVPRDPRPGAEAARRMIRDRQTTEDPLPGACEACGDTDAQWCPDCGACRKGCFDGHVDNTCTHPNAPWQVAS